MWGGREARYFLLLFSLGFRIYNYFIRVQRNAPFRKIATSASRLSRAGLYLNTFTGHKFKPNVNDNVGQQIGGHRRTNLDIVFWGLRYIYVEGTWLWSPGRRHMLVWLWMERAQFKMKFMGEHHSFCLVTNLECVSAENNGFTLPWVIPSFRPTSSGWTLD